jgi:hypothetical protein
VCHPLLGRVTKHLGIGLEQIDRQEPVVAGWLIAGRNAQPDAIRIE